MRGAWQESERPAAWWAFCSCAVVAAEEQNLSVVCLVVKLKGDSEVGGFRICGGLFDFGFKYVAAEGIFHIADAIADVFGGALDEHLDGAVRKVADKAGQLVAMSDTMSREAKADALDMSDKDYVLSRHSDLLFTIHHSLLTPANNRSLPAG